MGGGRGMPVMRTASATLSNERTRGWLRRNGHRCGEHRHTHLPAPRAAPASSNAPRCCFSCSTYSSRMSASAASLRHARGNHSIGGVCRALRRPCLPDGDRSLDIGGLIVC
jgi:hypothetical protein